MFDIVTPVVVSLVTLLNAYYWYEYNESLAAFTTGVGVATSFVLIAGVFT